MIDASPPPPCPPPLIAAAFSLAAPPILFGSTGGIVFLPTPLGFGAGHALAGDWRRAGLVSAGGFAAMGTGARLGVGMNWREGRWSGGIARDCAASPAPATDR